MSCRLSRSKKESYSTGAMVKASSEPVPRLQAMASEDDPLVDMLDRDQICLAETAV